MNARTLENPWTLTADGGGRWRAVRLHEGLDGPARPPAWLLVESDADRADDDPDRRWFPDYEEIE